MADSNDPSQKDPLDSKEDPLDEEKEARRIKVMKRREEIAKEAEERKKSQPPSQKSTDSPSIADTTPKTTTVEVPAKVQMREDVVNSAVSFLTHEKVKNAPLSQKMAFFQKKGVTQEEIQEALRRADQKLGTNLANQSPSSTPAVAPRPTLPNYPNQNQIQQPNMPMQPNYQQQMMGYPQQQMGYGPIVPQPPKTPWYGTSMGLAITAVGCVSIGIGIAYLTKRFIAPLIFKDPEVEAKRISEQKAKEEATSKVLEELTTALKAIHQDNTELKDLLKKGFDQNESKEGKDGKDIAKLKRQISELDSELKKQKSIALDSKTFQSSPTWSPPAKSSIPSWQQKGNSTSNAPISSNSISTTSSTNGTIAPQEDPFTKMMKEQNQKKEEPQSPQRGYGDAPKPSGMTKIMDMLANGQMPDDIKDIDDKPIPTTENVVIEKGSKSAPPKPWQRNSQSSPKSEEPVGEISKVSEDLM